MPSACNKMLTDDKTGVAIRISPHSTLMTENKWRTIGVALGFLSLFVASNKAMATSAFSTGIPGIDTTRENTSVVGFILTIVEDASLHPKCPFAIASAAI